MMRTSRVVAAAVAVGMCWTALSAEKVIFDTDMVEDYDDVGALALLHRLADRQECEILATLTCTRDNSSVAAVEIVNAYYGRPEIPVGCSREIGVVGVPNGDKKRPGHQKFVNLAKRYPKWVRHANSSDAPDALEVYRKALASAADKSVTICSVGFLTNLRRLVESKGDAISPLDGVELVRRKVKCWYAMACNHPKGYEYNSKVDWQSSKIALEKWPTPIVFSDFQYGRNVYCGRKVSETTYAYANPVKDIFRWCLPSREKVRTGMTWDKSELGHTAWDETTVLAAVRGTGRYFRVQHGRYRMIGEDGTNEWIEDPKAPGGRLVGIMSNEDVGKTMDDLIAEEPALAPGETLYNGIVLPREWPPRIDINDPNPVKTPYLEAANIPKVIPIDVGRQLFVDDFLVQSTQGLNRVFFKPRKYHANPLLWPETKEELGLATELGAKPYPKKADGSYHAPWNPNYKTAPCCYTSGGGLWYDPMRKVYRLWYIAGWSYRIAYAESKDLIHWERPPVGLNGTNILRDKPGAWDTWVVWPNFAAANPYGDWKLYHSYGGNPGSGYEYASHDGFGWKEVARCGLAGDASTLFYNPFRQKWIWSLRSVWRDRSRNYREHSDFVEGAKWHFPMGGTAADGSRPFYLAGRYTNTCDVVNWLACDNADLPRTLDGKTFSNAQLYNFDATPYESVMIGLHKIMCGRDNEEAAHIGMPKTTEIHFGYSRDGFHFDRPDRTPAIGDSGWWKGEWDAGYLSPVSSGFVIKDEELWFLYAAMRGDTTEVKPPVCTLPNGMHCHGSIGAAILRRDGFAGMVADGDGELVTRPVKFSGAHFFVNADARFGTLAVEVLDEKGKAVSGYSLADCMVMDHENSTKRSIAWKGGDLKRFAGRPVSFRFKMKVATLYAFWVSSDAAGHSGGYLGGGGRDYPSLKDEPVVHKNFVCKEYVYEAPDCTPIVFSGESACDTDVSGEYCLWLDLDYADGTHQWQVRSEFSHEAHGWQKRTVAFVPPKPVKRILAHAFLRNGKGEARFCNLVLERRAGKGDLVAENRVTLRPYKDADLIVRQVFNGTKIETRREEVAADLPMPKPAVKGGFALWSSSPLVKVTPLTFPDAKAGVRHADLCLARRERESFQLNVTCGEREWRDGSLRLPVLRNADGEALKGAVTWQRVGYMARNESVRYDIHPNGVNGLEHWLPDALLSAAPFRVRKNSTQGLWVTVFAAEDAKPGTYRGEIEVTEGGVVQAKVPVSATVRNFTLPKTFGMDTSFSLMDGFMKAVYKDEWKKRKREAMDILLDARLNPDDISRTALPDMDEMLYAKSRGMSSFNVLNVVPEPTDGRLWTCFAPPEATEDPKFYPAFKKRLEPVYAAMKANGLLPLARLYGFDEREKRYYPGIEKIWRQLKADFPSLPLMTTAMMFRDAAQAKKEIPYWDITDIHCPLTSAWDEGLAERLRAKGEKAWWYVCCGPCAPYWNFASIEFPLIDARYAGLMTYSYGADGLLYWHVNYWEGTARLDEGDTYFPDWNTASCLGTPGDGVLLYPGKNHILSSVRIEALRDAVEDYEYLQLAAARGNSVADLRKLCRELGTQTEFTRDEAKFLAMREQIAKKAEK